MGPVQVLVIGYEEPRFTGEVLAEMARLTDAGLVRLVDVLLVARAEDGTFDTVEVPADDPERLPGLPPGNGALAAMLLGHSDKPDEDLDALDGPVWSLADSVPAGTTAAVALIEHLWAAATARGDPAHRRRPARRDLAALRPTWSDSRPRPPDLRRLPRRAGSRLRPTRPVSSLDPWPRDGTTSVHAAGG